MQDRAKALAAQTMRALTAYRVGGCPVTVRPCKRGCVEGSAHWLWTGVTFRPVAWGGQWVNSCGCNSTCSCGPLEEMALPAPVGRVDRVLVDGQPLPVTAYRVDNGNRLVRLDGGLWPVCQNMDKPDTEVGTMSVTYLNAYAVDGLGAYAAGVLACEYAKACAGAKCRLPSGVTDIARRGISMTITTGLFPDGVTGIREVDAYILRWNPNGLRMAPRVWSPDQRPIRVVTPPAPALLQAPTQQDLRLRQGDDYHGTISVTTAGGGPANLTGYTALAQLRRDVADADPTVDATFTTSVTGDQVTLFLPGATTATLTGDYVWDVEVTSGTGETTTLMYGRALVESQVSRV